MARSALMALTFINASTDQYATIAKTIATDSRLTALDTMNDGIQQITETVQTYHHQIYGLHLISAEPTGSLKLGTTTLTLFNFDRYGWQFQQWGEALVPQATIFFHRWNLVPGVTATSPISNLLLARLRLLTGARIIVRDYPMQATRSTSHSA